MTLKKPFVLVVEDVGEVAEIVQLYLQRLGAESHHAPDAQAALTFLESRLPDVIILDIGMPIMSGWEFLEIVRNQEDKADIPVIIMTAYTDPDSRTRGDALNVAAFLNKPVLYAQLKAAFTELTETPTS